MTSDLVSIIMPVFNGEKYLNKAIESVIAQKYPYWELVIIDDGSTDRTSSIVRKYREPRIRYIYQENQGQAAALNKGLDLSNGEIITTLDSDDWLPENSIEDRAHYLRDHPNFDVVYGDGWYCTEDGIPFEKFSNIMPVGRSGDVFDTLIISPFYGTGAAVLVRADALRRQNIRYDESISWCQDWDFYIRAAENLSFGFIPKITINYRIHKHGMTSSMSSDHRIRSIRRLREKVINSERFQELTDSTKNAFYYDYLIRDLHNLTDEQDLVFESGQFNQLSNAVQARLIRQTAFTYLSNGDSLDLVDKWLRSTLAISPLDMKTFVATLLFKINRRFAVILISRWQSFRTNQTIKSPFDLAEITFDKQVNQS